MPYPNEHAARISAPIPSNASITKRKQIAPGISIIIQRNKGDDEKSMHVQAYRFNKRYFTIEKAKQWLKSHDIKSMSFEPAIEADNQGEQENRSDMINRITKEIGQELI